VPGRAESSRPETLPGPAITITAAASHAAPGHIQAFRGSQRIRRFLIMPGTSDVGNSMPD
jgi:hypothetical protein